MKNLSNILLLALISAGFAGCAHQSTVTPSNGHIDGQSNPSQPSQANAADIPKPVKTPAYLPPPKAKAKEQTYSVVVNDVPVKEILFALARESKLNVDIHPDIKGVVTMNAVDQSLSSILERISKQVDLTYTLENNILTIRPDTPYLKSYQINYVNIDRVTKGSVSVSNQIASTTISNSSGSSSGGSSSSTSGTNAKNTSSTEVTSNSENHLWDSIIDNIKNILLESDKEVLISRFATDSNLRDSYNVNGSTTTSGEGSASTYGISGNNNSGNQAISGNVNSGGATGSGNQSLDASTLANRNALKETNAKEYRQLYAASVIPNKETGVLSVRATRRQQEKVQEFLDKVQASARRQVLIEASIVEIKLNDQYQAGVDWSKLASGGLLDGFTYQQALLGNTLTTAPAIAIGYNKSTGSGDFAASVRLLQTFGTTKVLSSPKLMVLNSQTAILKAVDNLVYFTVQSTAATIGTGGTVISPATYTTTPQTIPVGVWMSVTPQINENGIVTLNVRPTISRKSGDVKDPNPSLTITSNVPQITVREMESMLQVPSGNTVILGGLMQDEIAETSNGVPFFSSIPFFGNAFKARNNNYTKTELVIFLRPTVIPNASLESDELKTYKQYLPESQLEKKLDGNGY